MLLAVFHCPPHLGAAACKQDILDCTPRVKSPMYSLDLQKIYTEPRQKLDQPPERYSQPCPIQPTPNGLEYDLLGVCRELFVLLAVCRSQKHEFQFWFNLVLGKTVVDRPSSLTIISRDVKMGG